MSRVEPVADDARLAVDSYLAAIAEAPRDRGAFSSVSKANRFDDGYLGKCVAPPAEPASGPRQLGDIAHIPSGLMTAPAVTSNPPGRVRAPSDVAPVSTVS